MIITNVMQIDNPWYVRKSVCCHKDRLWMRKPSGMSSTTRIFNQVFWAKNYSYVVRALVSMPSCVGHFTKGRDGRGKSVSL